MPTVIGPSGSGCCSPVLFRSLEQVQLPFLAQLLLDPFRRCLQVIADRLRVRRIASRQHVFQQVHHFGKRNQRSPFRLQVKQFRTGSPLQPHIGGPECICTRRVAGAPVPARIWYVDLTKYRLDRRAAGILGGVALAAARTLPVLLQIFVYLVRDHQVLHPFQQCLAFLQTHAQGLHHQFRPLDRHHIPALFSSVRAYAHDLHANAHGRRLLHCCNWPRRSSTSLKLNRSGCSGPHSFSLRSKLRKPSSKADRNRSQVAGGWSGQASANISIPASNKTGSDIAVPSLCLFNINRYPVGPPQCSGGAAPRPPKQRAPWSPSTPSSISRTRISHSHICRVSQM
jgi:hypothetical protein